MQLGEGAVVPARGVEDVGGERGGGCWVPDGGGVVDCVGGDGEDGSLGEVVREEGYAGAGGDDAREAERGGRVDAEGFGYYVAEAVSQLLVYGGRVLGWEDILRQVFDHIILRYLHPLRNRCIQLLLQLFHHTRRL